MKSRCENGARSAPNAKGLITPSSFVVGASHFDCKNVSSVIYDWNVWRVIKVDSSFRRARIYNTGYGFTFIFIVKFKHNPQAFLKLSLRLSSVSRYVSASLQIKIMSFPYLYQILVQFKVQ